jgi:lauroyl/myristoyl acyltransferase
MADTERVVPTGSTPRGRTAWSPRPVPWGGVLARLRASVQARRVVPTGVALLGTDLLYRLVWRLSSRRMAATSAVVDTIVGGTPAEADLPRLARGYVAARARGWELTWRPWELARIPVRGVSRIHQARATGRGLVISHAHLGPLAGWVVLGRLLHPMLAPQGDWLLDEPRPGYNGYQVERWRRIYHEAGIELIHATGSGLMVYKALKRGSAVLLAMDVPGNRRTRFLGKPVDLDDGTARLAVKTDALVLPAALMPVGRRWEIQIGEALDPREFSSPDELHLALAAIHEELIMRAPEHLESPPLWLWGRATRDGWFRD